uniref:G-protein coupled receptors family 1 profile domain-containing protein n=1 Tax=Kryptolebias marmoratus TaxID=37003 RepID=A0A3Q2ZXW2_KRYMA
MDPVLQRQSPRRKTPTALASATAPLAGRTATTTASLAGRVDLTMASLVGLSTATTASPASPASPVGLTSSGRPDLPETNGSASGRPGPEAVVVPVVFGLIFVVGVVGNTLVMVVIGRVKSSGGARALSPTNIFIMNLSVADLLFILFCVPLHATIYSLPEWVFGAFLCRFGHFFSNVTMLVSIFTLVAMSVDRYIAVVRSKSFACVRSRRNALFGLCVIWTLSLLCSVPVAQHYILTNHPRAPNSTFCWENWSGAPRVAYKVSVTLLGFVTPLLLICCCYTRVSSQTLSFHGMIWDCCRSKTRVNNRTGRSKRKVLSSSSSSSSSSSTCTSPP